MTDLKQSDKTTTTRLHGLDHLRALAIILVFFFHYRLFGHPHWVQKVGIFGWTGVDLFFVLSGYLIASQLFETIAENKKIFIGEFYFKRLMRTIPAYLVVVAIYFLVPAFRETEALPPLWKFLTFTQNFGIDVKHYATFSHAWSLCIEEQFYFLLPIITAILIYFKAGKKSFVLLIGLFILGFLLRGYIWIKFVSPFVFTDNYFALWARWIYYPTYTRLDGLLTGIAIAGIFKFYPNVKEYFIRQGNILLIISFLILGSTYFLYLHQFSIALSLFSFPLIAFGYGLLVVSAISPTSILYKLNSKITKAIATLSYSIYLTHKGLIHVTQQQFVKFGIGVNSYVMLLLCIIVVIAGAIILHLAIEKPFLQLRNNMLKKHRVSL
jgi:peptidoglycan/LPS O-acetylase OafA/YrhL